MTVDLDTLLAILAMAAATIATRIAGLVLIRYVTIGENQKRALEAIPPAVLMAVIAPTALVTGPAETIAAAATAVAATRTGRFRRLVRLRRAPGKPSAMGVMRFA